MGVSVDGTLGALYIGNIVTAIMFGVTSVQAYYYFSHYPEDRKILKLLVAMLVAMYVLHLSFICCGVYYYAVTNHGNPAALLYFHWSLNLQFLTAVLSILIIILIFTNRITLLIGKKRYLWGLMILMVAATTIISTVSFVMGFYITNFQEYRDRTLWTAYLNLSVTIACDSVTTTSLIFVLRKQKSPFKRSRSTINKVIFYTVNTAALTSVTSVACLVTFVVLPSSLVSLALVFILPKLYLNSLLGLLNCRKKLRSELLHDGPISILFDSSVNRVVLSTANDGYGVKANMLVHSS